MIKKILKIFNVGRFEKYSASGDVEFKKINTIYAENGRGKTTLSAIIRSLKNNDPVFISERKTLGTEQSPEVEILIDSKTYKFLATWSEDYPDIEMFDSVFVDKNVFSGEHVEHDHRRNLYRFVVGERGVALALKVDELDGNARNNNVDITEKKVSLQRCIVGNQLSIDDFIKLENIENIKDLINAKEKEIEVLKKTKLIESKSLLQKIVIPDYPQGDIEKTLEKTLTEISQEAETKTKQHIKAHLDAEGEEWIQKGFLYMREDCPFCGQNIDENGLIEAYKGYFDASYMAFKEDIKVSGQRLKQAFSETSLSYLQRIHSNNDSLFEFWKEYVEFGEPPDLLFEEIESSWRSLNTQTLEHIRKKYLAPLEVVNPSNELKSAIKIYIELQENVKLYNIRIEQINEQIQKKKLAASGGELPTVVQELEKFKNVISRYEQGAQQLCSEYISLLEMKKNLENQKKKAKADLDEFTAEVFKKYQESINKYLKIFGAGFEIVETKTGYIGGRPSSNYCIKINDVSVDLGDTRTYGKPCFRNILSQGDKNALAFAFFLSRLEQDDNLSNKVIIFDDPISSLDSHRRSCTEQEIIRIAGLSRQCLVMSHDKHFLRAIWNKGANDQVKSLQIIRTTDGSKIIEWDILADTKGAYFDDFYTLIKFQGSGVVSDRERRSVARCIRPILEGYVRIKFPKDFLEGWWLGQFIQHVDQCTETQFVPLKNGWLQNLKDVNDYSKKYHHDSNPNADSEGINDSELNTFITRTLDFIKS